MRSVYETTPHHLWAGKPGARPHEPKEPLRVAFDADLIDFTARLPAEAGEAICQFELPHLCEARPHEDPTVEAWLLCWLDGIGGEVEEAVSLGNKEPPPLLTGAVYPGLAALAAEKPEVCPLLRGQLKEFDESLASWLRGWPAAEPLRDGLPKGPEPGHRWPRIAEFELELYAALALFRSQAGSSLPRSSEPLLVGNFCQMALGWIFKLDAVYGLSLLEQPERMLAAGACQHAGLSLLEWHVSQVSELLGVPYFRPEEQTLWRFARRWWLEGGGMSAGFPEQEASDAFSNALVWELLAANDQPQQPEAVADGPAVAAEGLSIESGAVQHESVAELGELGLGAASPELGAPTSGAADLPAESPEAMASGDAEAAPTGVGSCNADSQSHLCAAAGEVALQRQPSNGRRPSVEERPHSRLSQVNGACLVPGASFQRMKRAAGCPVEEIAGAVAPADLKQAQRPSGSLQVWNTASEAVIIGAGRQLLASDVPMSAARDGKYRLDLRVISGTEAESAHLLEIGVAAAPWRGCHFKPYGPGADRPQLSVPGFAAPPAPFFRIVPVTDVLIEGVRLSVEVDFHDKMVRLRNLPEVEGVEAVAPTPMAAWLQERSQLVAVEARPSGELDDPLFREQAQHLHELIDQGMLSSDLASAVLGDRGAQCVVGYGHPEVAEDYYYYVVVPAGMELELF
eukprot:TRINITY_DN91188_c0_g1_i1.p1 TRINITY_DN91188_c0_g1~~TRINITY_DN91188_c0_g1_i1.p1  ORF type:complete len:685 (+),score=163.60 TRINITY_DN91188_c0_g1_i1:53-2107(+)